MKLLKCYVSSFGTLKNFNYDFSEGLNTIKEDNGFGKSTFATFIKSMFYGLAGGGKRSIDDNERLKFKPWNSSEKFGGYVIFEKGGKEYKIERFFGSKEAEDTVAIYDLQTGKPFANVENLGKRIFEIDEEGFESTTYYSQKDFQAKSNNSLTEKYNAMCDVGSSESFDEAIQRIKDKAKKYKYSGDRGYIPDAKREILAIDKAIEDCIYASESADRLTGDVKDLENELGVINNDIKNLTKKIEQAGKAEALVFKQKRIDALISREKNLVERQNQINDSLNGWKISASEIGALEDCVKELNGIKAKMQAISNEIEGLIVQKTNQKQLPSISKNVSLIFSVIALIAGISLAFVELILGASLIAISLIIGVLSFTVFNKIKQAGDDSSQIDQLKGDYISLSKIKDEYEEKLNGFLSRFNLGGEDYGVALEKLKRALEIDFEIQAELNSIIEEKNQLINDVGGEGKVLGNFDIEMLKSEMDRLNAKFKNKTEELARRKSSIAEYENQVGLLPELKSQKTLLLEKLDTLTEELRVLDLTAEYLQGANDNLKVKYRAPLQESFEKYIKLIDGAKTAMIDVDFNVTIDENGSQKKTDYYSKGYQNLFEICKRFALINVLFAKEKPFIILDDPFYNLDDKKLNASIDLIRRLAEEYQIIYFVCHDSRRA